jgi:hypothetical protein
VVRARAGRTVEPPYREAMDYELRRVTRLPLTELWNASGPVSGQVRREELTAAEIEDLLRASPVQFVEIVMSKVPNWVPLDDRFAFWKERLQPLLTQWGPENRIYTHELPVYVASEWSVDGVAVPVVVAVLYD